MSTITDDLKSCPFCAADECGDEGVRLRRTPTCNSCFEVVCSCGAAGPSRKTEEMAMEAWNVRAHLEGELDQTADTSTTTELPTLSGALKSFDFFVILQLLSSADKTGILRVKQGQEAREIYLRDGEVVAASGNERLRLGQIGCNRGLISLEQVQEALFKVKKTGRRMGEVLLTEGYLEEEGLKELIFHQILEIALEISLWEDGVFEYHDHPVCFDEVGTKDISTMRVVFEAAVRKDEQAVAWNS